MNTSLQSNITRLELITDSSYTGPLGQEQETIIRDLLARGHFQPLNDNNGPYEITLSLEDNRLVIRTRNSRAQDLSMLVLAVKPYKRLIQDYYMMIESYEHARRHATREKLEAIDMGRRGIHNEGATLLRERLKDKIDMDFETARGFFTLICVLHAQLFFIQS